MKKGQTVCIIEAMKLMNEIEAQFSLFFIPFNKIGLIFIILSLLVAIAVLHHKAIHCIKTGHCSFAKLGAS